MRRLKHLVIMAVAAVILVTGSYVLQDVYHSYTKNKQYASLELSTTYQDSIEFDELVKKMTQDGVGFAFWNKKKDVSITSTEFGRSQTVNAIKVRGNSGCIYPDCNALHLEDEGSCMIDKDTALLLFGSTNMIGQSIQYEEQRYVLKGILYDEKAIFVYVPQKGQGVEQQTPYDHLTMKIQEGLKADDMIRNVENLYGLNFSENNR